MAKVTAIKKNAVKGSDDSKEMILAKVRAVLDKGHIEDQKVMVDIIGGAYRSLFSAPAKKTGEISPSIPGEKTEDAKKVNGELIMKALYNYFDESGLEGDLTFAESTLDIFELSSSFGHKLDEIDPKTARTLLNKARLTLREGIGKVQRISDLIEKVIKEG
jgi:hypothetical protein